MAQSAASTVITSGDLAYADSSTTAANETYTVTTAPTNGTLYKNGVALTTNSTFTQADINNNLITYTQNGSDTDQRQFAFTVSDPSNFSASGTFSITIAAAGPGERQRRPGAGRLLGHPQHVESGHHRRSTSSRAIPARKRSNGIASPSAQVRALEPGPLHPMQMPKE